MKDLQAYIALCVGIVGLFTNFAMVVAFVVLTRKGISDLKKQYDDLKNTLFEDGGKPRYQYAGDCRSYRDELKKYFDDKFDGLKSLLEVRQNETIKRVHKRIDDLEKNR